MKRLAKRLAIVAGIIVVAIYLADLALVSSVTLRYRLTVAVDVNGLTHTGSGVVGVTYKTIAKSLYPYVFMPFQGQFRGAVRGNAITVDLGKPGLLFVVNFRPFLADKQGYIILKHGSALDLLPFVAYGLPTDHPPWDEVRYAAQIARAKPRPIAIAPETLPMLVRFTDIADRNTIEEVDPRDFSASFGPGVHLKSVTFELTRDPVTPMPATWPTWLKRETHTYFRFHHQTLWSYVGIWTDAFKGDRQ